MAARSRSGAPAWVPVPRRRRVVVVAAAALAGLAALLTLALLADGDRAAAVGSDLVQAGAAVFAAVSCLRVASVPGGRRWARGWRLIGLGMLAWTAGQLVWSYVEVVRGVPGPELSVADVGFLAMVPLMLVGLGELIGVYRRAAMGLIEGLVVAGSLFYLSWATVLGSIYHLDVVSPTTWLQWVVNLAYPVGDVAIAAAAIILLGSVHPGHRPAVALLAIGTVALSISDSFYATSSDTYRSGHPIDLGWIGGFVLIGLAGIVARSTAAADPPDSTLQEPRTWMSLPYLPLAVAALASIALAAAGRPANVLLAVLLVALFGLVLVRQLLALRERRALAAELRTSLHQLRQQEEILNQLAYSDALTGLANRALFDERTVPRGHPRRGLTTVAFVDLDQFKDINDTYGHHAGDAVLVTVGRRLRACARGEDIVARVGGDEFVIIAHGVAGATAERLGHRILTALRQPVTVDGRDLAVSASVGLAVGDTTEVTVHELIRRADAAMYVAKVSGKNRQAIHPSSPAGRPAPARSSTVD